MTASSTRRVRPGFVKLSIVALVLLAPIVAHAVWDYVETRRLRTRIDAIAARGEPLSARGPFTELTGDAAVSERLYRGAAALSGGGYDELPPPMASRIRTALREQAWPGDVVAALRAYVGQFADVFPLVDRAASLPFERFETGTPFNPLQGQLMALAALCDRRAALRAIDGDGDGAVASLISEAAIGRAMQLFLPSFSALPFVLERAHPSAAARQRLGPALAALDRDDMLKQRFLGTRAMMIDEYDTPRGREWPSPARTLRTHVLVNGLDWYTEAARIAGRPWPERRAAFAPGGAAALPDDRRGIRGMFDGTARFVQLMSRGIRCSRLRVDPSLKLVDPQTGRVLMLAECKL